MDKRLKLACSLTSQAETTKSVQEKTTMSTGFIPKSAFYSINPQIRPEKGRILIADEDVLNRQHLINILTLEAYEIIAVTDGEEALKEVYSHPFDLVILSVTTPKKSGYEVCDEIRKKYTASELPVLISIKESEKLKSDETGANDYLIKPFTKQALVSLVHGLMKKRGPSEELEETEIELKREEQIKALHAANENLTKLNHDLTIITESRSQMLVNISHELGASVTLIKGYLQALQSKTIQLDDRYFNDLVNKKMKMLERLIFDLSELSALETKAVSFKFEEIAVLDYIERTFMQAELEIANYNRQFKKHFNQLPLSEFYCVVDEERMNQVFMNIIRNAVKNTLENTGKIEIGTKVNPDKQELLIKIKDNGTGISEEDLPFIFQRFYKGTDPSAKNAQRGLGLGLAIVKEIIEAHDAIIKVESTLEEGTTFIMILPIYKYKE